MIKISVIIFLIFIGACSQSAQSENADWVNQLIIKFQSEAIGNPPQSIWRYEYKGQTVYYFPPQCCDQFSVLYNSSGNSICAPDGGFTGKGDGRCADFFTKRTNEKLVWKDPRTQ